MVPTAPVRTRLGNGWGGGGRRPWPFGAGDARRPGGRGGQGKEGLPRGGSFRAKPCKKAGMARRSSRCSREGGPRCRYTQAPLSHTYLLAAWGLPQARRRSQPTRHLPGPLGGCALWPWGVLTSPLACPGQFLFDRVEGVSTATIVDLDAHQVSARRGWVPTPQAASDTWPHVVGFPAPRSTAEPQAGPPPAQHRGVSWGVLGGPGLAPGTGLP